MPEKSKEKNIPTVIQLVKEFDMSRSAFDTQLKKESSRIEIYNDAWFYRQIKKKMTIAQMKEYKEKEPTVVELEEEFDVTDKNLYALKKSDSKMYQVYCEAWLFRNFVVPTIVNHSKE